MRLKQASKHCKYYAAPHSYSYMQNKQEEKRNLLVRGRWFVLRFVNLCCYIITSIEYVYAHV